MFVHFYKQIMSTLGSLRIVKKNRNNNRTTTGRLSCLLRHLLPVIPNAKISLKCERCFTKGVLSVDTSRKWTIATWSCVAVWQFVLLVCLHQREHKKSAAFANAKKALKTKRDSTWINKHYSINESNKINKVNWSIKTFKVSWYIKELDKLNKQTSHPSSSSSIIMSLELWHNGNNKSMIWNCRGYFL